MKPVIIIIVLVLAAFLFSAIWTASPSGGAVVIKEGQEASESQKPGLRIPPPLESNKIVGTKADLKAEVHNKKSTSPMSLEDHRKMVANLPDYEGEYYPLSEIPGDLSKLGLNGFTIEKDRVYENWNHDMALRSADGKEKIYIKVYAVKEGQQPKGHIQGLLRSTGAGYIGRRGDLVAGEASSIGDYNFVTRFQSTRDEIVFVRNNYYVQVRSHRYDKKANNAFNVAAHIDNHIKAGSTSGFPIEDDGENRASGPTRLRTLNGKVVKGPIAYTNTKDLKKPTHTPK